MKKMIGFFILIACMAGFSSCEKVKGKGDVVPQVRNVTGFTGISLAIDATVYFSPDSNYYLEVIAQQNMLDIIETVIGSNNTLTIKYKDGVIIGNHEPIKIFIAGPSMQSLNISGSGDFLVDTPWMNPLMTISISGSGNVTISELETNELHVNISGAGNVQGAMGSATYQELTISGSGNVDLVGVESETTYVNISGSGNMSVWVTKLLDITISGSGTVNYKGDPVLTTHISGSGTIVKL